MSEQLTDLNVYSRVNRQIRESYPLYKAVEILANRYSRGGIILDLGCNDLIASGSLIKQDMKVIGLDLNFQALREARNYNPDSPTVQARLPQLPFLKNEQVDLVLAMDVIEHLAYSDGLKLLHQLNSTFPNHILIASMPIISLLSIPTVHEAFSMLKHGRKPDVGLFDKTHLIFRDATGHKKLFRQAGYEVLEEYRTNWVEAVSGFSPEDLGLQGDKYHNPLRQAFCALFYETLPRLIHPFSPQSRRGVIDTLTAYQGLYVLSSEPLPSC